jgi:hypothetical protein
MKAGALKVLAGVYYHYIHINVFSRCVIYAYLYIYIYSKCGEGDCELVMKIGALKVLAGLIIVFKHITVFSRCVEYVYLYVYIYTYIYTICGDSDCELVMKTGALNVLAGLLLSYSIILMYL